MNDDVLIATLNRLENKVDNLSTGLATNTQVTKSHTDMLSEIKDQVQKTNGRVTSLESTQVKLANVSSQNSGIIVDIQDRLRKEEARGERTSISVNKLIKNERKVTDLGEKKEIIKEETNSKVKVGFWTALFTSATGLIAYFFTK